MGYKDKGGALFFENGEGIKTLFLFNANNKDADYDNLFSTFGIHCMRSIISIHAKSKISRL